MIKCHPYWVWILQPSGGLFYIYIYIYIYIEVAIYKRLKIEIKQLKRQIKRSIPISINRTAILMNRASLIYDSISGSKPV